jgi:hypothetical protein
VSSLPLDGEWQLALDRPNALRLNRWRIACDGRDWASPEMDDSELAEVEALPLQYRDQWVGQIRHQCERKGDISIWYRRPVNCEYVPENLALLVENGAIDGRWTMFVNGILLSPHDFAPCEYHGADKIAARISQLFRVGENVLALRVDNAPEWGGLRTPLHLIGDFALGGAEQRMLTALPDTASFNNLSAAGLPHFSGTATFKKRVESEDDSSQLCLELPSDFHDIALVRIDGRPLDTRAWSPYMWVLPEVHNAVTVEIAVTNTLLPFMEGKQWDTTRQTAESV